MQRRISYFFCLLSTFVFMLLALPTFAQDWSLTVHVDFLPSPYLSDWEYDPNTLQVTIINDSGEAESVLIDVELRLDGSRIAHVVSRPVTIETGVTDALALSDLVDWGDVDYDDSIEEQAIRTGRLPEGDYEVCIRLLTRSGAPLLDEVCTVFTITLPDPPELVFPSHGEVLADPYPVFEWFFHDVSGQLDVRFLLRLVEVIGDEPPARALETRLIHHEERELLHTSFPYPVDGLPLLDGHVYAWQVQVLDRDSRPPTVNNGQSEIYTFTHHIEPVVEMREVSGTILSRGTGEAVGRARVILTLFEDGAPSAFDQIDVDADQYGYYVFPEVLDGYDFEVRGLWRGYVAEGRLSTSEQQYGEVTDFDVRLSSQIGGARSVAGKVEDLYTEDPIPGALVRLSTYRYDDNTRDGRLIRIEGGDQTKTAEDDGSFFFPNIPDQTWYSIEAGLTPRYENQEIAQAYLDDDATGQLIRLKPVACTLDGTVVAMRANGLEPLSGIVVNLVQEGVGGPGMSAMTRQDGSFDFKEIQPAVPGLPGRFLLTFESDFYKTSQPPEPYPFDPGEAIETGEHVLLAQTGTITGTVTSATASVDGTIVTIIAPSPGTIPEPQSGTGDGTPPANDGEPDPDWIGQSAERPAGTEIATTTTGPQGAFEFTDILINDPWNINDAYVVWIEAPGHETVSRLARLAADGDVVDLPVDVVPRAAYVYGVVAEAGGAVVSGARIELVNYPGGSDTYTVVDFAEASSGDFTLPDVVPGTYRLLVSADGYQQNQSSLFMVETGAEVQQDLELSRPACKFMVTVVKEDSTGIAGALVKTSGMSSIYSEEYTDENGVWYTDESPCGLTILNVSAYGYSPEEVIVTTKVENDTTKVRVELEAPSSKLHVTVVDSVTNLVLMNFDVSYGEGDTHKGRTGPDGTVTLDKVPVGTKKLVVEAPKDESYPIDYTKVEKSVSVEAGEEHEIVILMKPAGRISGLVKLKDEGTLLKDVQVAVEGDEDVNDMTNAQGIYKLRNVPVGGTVKLIATSPGYKIERMEVPHLSAGQHMRDIVFEMEKSEIDSLFGFPVAVDSLVTAANGQKKVTGAIISPAMTFGIKLKDLSQRLYFKDILVDSLYAPVNDSERLETDEIDVKVFGMAGKLKYPGGLVLEWTRPDTVQTDTLQASTGGAVVGRISGLVSLDDGISRYLPDSECVPFSIPRFIAPSFWSDGVNRDLAKLGLTCDDSTVRLKFKGVSVGVDYTQTYLDSTGFHFGGVLGVEWPRPMDFHLDDLHIGRDTEGRISLLGAGIRTDPPIEIPIFAVTLVDSSFAWRQDGFWLAGAIKYQAGAKEYVWGLTNFHISPKGVPLSAKLVWDDENGKITIAGQTFKMDSFEFGTENADVDSIPNVIYLMASGKLTVTCLDQPVEFEKFKLSFDGEFSGKVSFNQSIGFKNIVFLQLGDFEIGKDDDKGKFFGFSAGIRFGAIQGLGIQASDFKFYDGGEISFKRIGFDLNAGAVVARLGVGYADGVFEGDGLLRLQTSFTLDIGAEFRFAGPNDWWVQAVASAPIPLYPCPCDLAQVRGGLGLTDGLWRMMIGGRIAPTASSFAFSLDMETTLYLLPGPPLEAKLIGTAGVLVAGDNRIGEASITFIFHEATVLGSIQLGYNGSEQTPPVPLEAFIQLDLGTRFGDYWFVHGYGELNFFDFLTANAHIVVAQGWTFEYGGQRYPMNGMRMEMEIPEIDEGGDYGVVGWAMHLEQHASFWAPFSGDVGGAFYINAEAEAYIGIPGIFVARVEGDFEAEAAVAKTGSVWTANGRAQGSMEARIGNCTPPCNRICVGWFRFGARVCKSMYAAFDYSEAGLRATARFN